MEYSRQDIEQYADFQLEFAEWMGHERFINIEAVICSRCGGNMSLRCTKPIFSA